MPVTHYSDGGATILPVRDCPMVRIEHYRQQASECLARSRACTDQKDAAQLAIIAARYFELAKQREHAKEAPTDRE
jgi:hypothetical protein